MVKSPPPSAAECFSLGTLLVAPEAAAAVVVAQAIEGTSFAVAATGIIIAFKEAIKQSEVCVAERELPHH